MHYQGPIRPGMRFRCGDDDVITVDEVQDGNHFKCSWTSSKTGSVLHGAFYDIGNDPAVKFIRPTTPEEWALYAPDSPINNQLRAADLRPGMVIATTMPDCADIWWLWRFERVDEDGDAHGDIFAASHKNGIGKGLFDDRNLLNHSIILFDAKDGEAKPYTTTVVDKPEPGAVNLGALGTPAADPRDAAIARWPWMERFRDVKAGDVFRIENTTYRPIRTVASVRWVEGHLTWDFDSTWSMASDAGWDLLQPYRMPSPAKPAAPTCNACHKPAPLGYAGRCWPCELKEEREVAILTQDGRLPVRPAGDVINKHWAARIRADMALDVSPPPGGAAFGALWRGRVPR